MLFDMRTGDTEFETTRAADSYQSNGFNLNISVNC